MFFYDQIYQTCNLKEFPIEILKTTLFQYTILFVGQLYLEELKPGVGYRESLKEDHSALVGKLKELFGSVQTKLKLKDNEIFLDESKPRILVSKKTVKKNKNKIINLGLVPAIVVEYPTADQLEIEVDFIGF